MTGKINTADLAYYYEPENFDKDRQSRDRQKYFLEPDHRHLVPAAVAERRALQRT